MDAELVEILTQLSLEPVGSDRVGRARTVLASAPAESWPGVVQTLEMHRIGPLAGYALRTHALEGALPAVALAALKAAERRTTLANTLYLHALERVLRALHARGLDPVVVKGAVLADSYYPEIGTRVMSDIDLVIGGDEVALAREALAGVGFRVDRTSPSGDALSFRSDAGIELDVHSRFRLYEGLDWTGLTTRLVPSRCGAPPFLVFEPTAMVAHLVVHLQEHRREWGHVLSWIVDLAFVMRRSGEQVDAERLAALLPSHRDMVAFLRILRLFETTFELRLPAQLAAAAARVEPRTVAEVLRDRRMAPWGLPGLRGWARLGASLVFDGPRRGRVSPRWSDLLCLPGDVRRERRALRRVPRPQGERGG